MPSESTQIPIHSVELFPPKTPEGMEKLKLEIASLNSLAPTFFSVTYGAGGSTREGTFDTVNWLRGQGIDTAPHLACIGSTREQVREILTQYREQGIDRLVALRGDMPSGMGAGNSGDFRYANELVSFVRAEFGDSFMIEVAAYPEYHPQSGNPARDLENFKRKVEAGADGAITQYFYNADAYFGFLESCRKEGIGIPIVPGIMPITNYTQLARFSDTCGAEIPRWIRRRLEGYGDDVESLRAFGHEIVLNLCRQLIAGGAPGLHFYTMNQSGPVRRLWTELGLPTGV
ncbi:methylenetetrahydrofolate reductase [NAD(P)H] [Thiocystis violacea]|uniref:methylenetetrahydrofolate reductase [NAD(P)H] n=1 Tax=Thiocystis violacea TaxID=13725 RepID=UPI001F5B3D0B|nr:methylenetetrahydrofolate reductase [NAD(P)H] [Thiocystis violacea]